MASLDGLADNEALLSKVEDSVIALQLEMFEQSACGICMLCIESQNTT